MARIATLPLGTPTAAKYLAFDSDPGGAKRATVEDTVAVGADALGIPRLSAARNVGFDDFNAPSGGWRIFEGEAQVADTLSALGFASDGVMVFSIATQGTGGDFTQIDKFQVANPSIALIPDDAAPTVFEFRVWRLQTISGDTPVADDSFAQFGIGAARFGDGGPTDAIALFDNAGEWALMTQVDGGDPSVASVELPDGDTLQVRFTLRATSWSCEVSVDDGATYTDLGSPGVAPPAKTLLPWIQLAGTEHGVDHGPRFSAWDWFKWDAARNGSGASPWSGENAPKWPDVLEPGESGEIQRVDYGGSNQSGGSNRYARADHTHQGPDDPSVPNPGSSAQDVDTMASGGTSADYARADHVHRLTVATAETVLSNLSTATIGAGSGALTVQGTSITVTGSGAVALQGVSGAEIEIDGSGGIAIAAALGASISSFNDLEINAHSAALALTGTLTDMSKALGATSFAPTFGTSNASVTGPAAVADWVHVRIGTLHFVIGEVTFTTTNSGSAFRPFFEVDMPSSVTTIRGAMCQVLNEQTTVGSIGSMTAKVTISSTPTLTIQFDYQPASGGPLRAFFFCVYE